MSYAEGHWCKDCQWFEEGLDESDETCPACGHPLNNHIPVKVVDR